MTHPTTEPDIRERLARRYCAAFWPNHPWDEAAEWQHDASWKAVDTILAEQFLIASEMNKRKTPPALKVQWDYFAARVQHIRDGGK